MGAEGKAEAGTEGTEETEAVNMAGIGVVSIAGEATADTPAETPNSPKVSASRKIDVQMKKEMNEA